MSLEQGPAGDRLPTPPRQLSRPAPLPVTGRQAVRQVLHELCTGSRQECLMMHDQGAAPEARHPVRSGPGLEVRALDDVILVRYVVAAESGTRSETGGTGAGGAHRARRPVAPPDQGPLRLVVVDRSAALVPLHPGRTFEAGALLVRDRAVTGSLHAMYSTLWRQARRLPACESGPPPALLPVLDMLLQGLTDAAAAKRLGISPRTYSRRVAQLLGALGVTTRTQVGAEALAKGWIARRPS